MWHRGTDQMRVSGSHLKDAESLIFERPSGCQQPLVDDVRVLVAAHQIERQNRRRERFDLFRAVLQRHTVRIVA